MVGGADVIQAPSTRELVAEVRRLARRADLRRPDTFADASLRAGRGATRLVDLTCGSLPHLAARWRARGHEGFLSFVDWRWDALAAHRAALVACGRALGPVRPGPAAWLRADFRDRRFDGAWLAIHLTLPRWSDGSGGAHRPSGRADGARLLRELARTGARGVSALLYPLEHDTLVDGAAILGWPVEIEHDVYSAEFEPQMPGPCLHVRFAEARRGRRLTDRSPTLSAR